MAALQELQVEANRVDTMGHPTADTFRKSLPENASALEIFVRTGELPPGANRDAMRQERSLTKGRSAEKARKRKKDKGKKKKKKSKKRSSTSTSASPSSSDSDLEEHRFREHLDQSQKGTFRDLPETTLVRARRRWKWLHHNIVPPKVRECSDAQLSALAGRFLKRKKIVYFDFGIFRPNAAELQKLLAQIGGPGSRLPDGRRRGDFAGPHNFLMWSKYWDVAAYGCEGLDILSPTVTFGYHSMIQTWDEEWNADGQSWWIIAEADEYMRQWKMREYLNNLIEIKDPSLVGDSFRHGDRRMEAVFEVALRDKDWWNTNIKDRIQREKHDLLKKKEEQATHFGPLRRITLQGGGQQQSGQQSQQQGDNQDRQQDGPPKISKRQRKRARIGQNNAGGGKGASGSVGHPEGPAYPPPGAGAQVPPPAGLGAASGAQNKGKGKDKGTGQDKGGKGGKGDKSGKPSKNLGICNNWRRTGSCWRGDQCWFRHE